MGVLGTVPHTRARIYFAFCGFYIYIYIYIYMCVCVCVCVNPEAVNVSLTTLSKLFKPQDYLSNACRPAACLTLHLPHYFLWQIQLPVLSNVR
jgi:hypothetical protein